RARAFAVQIQIADMKLFARAMQFCFVAAIDSTSKTKLRVVRDLECIVVILCLDHGEHWTKDLFLLDRRTWLDVCNHCRFDEEALLAIRTTAGHDASTFTLP